MIKKKHKELIIFFHKKSYINQITFFNKIYFNYFMIRQKKTEEEYKIMKRKKR